MMEEMMGHFNHKICVIWLDDIIIYSHTFEDHLIHVAQVFQQVADIGLKLSPFKGFRLWDM